MDLKLKKRNSFSWWVVDPTGRQVGIVEKGVGGWRSWLPDGSPLGDKARSTAYSTRDQAMNEFVQLEKKLGALQRVLHGEPVCDRFTEKEE